MTSTPEEMAARIAQLESENTALKTMLEKQSPQGYTLEWVKQQFEQTVAICGLNENLFKALQIFGNRVLMQFGDHAGMHQAFTDFHTQDHAEPMPKGPKGPVVPMVSVPVGWYMEVAQNEFETQLTLWGPGEQQVAAFPVPVGSEYANILREFAGALETIDQDCWQDIESAPQDQLLLLAAEFDGPHDWRIKVGGYWEGRWHVQGASWKPTKWRYMPTPPKESVKALKA